MSAHKLDHERGGAAFTLVLSDAVSFPGHPHNLMAERIRLAKAADAPFFEAAGDASSHTRTGSDAFLQHLRIHPGGNLIIERQGQPLGMLLSVRIDDASSLSDSDILRVSELHREHGAFWLVVSVHLASSSRQSQQQQQHAEDTRVRDELLRSAILLARACQEVRAVLLPVQTPGRPPAAQPPPPAAASLPPTLLLRREPLIQRHMACGARVLQPLPRSWWPSDDANGSSAGTPGPQHLRCAPPCSSLLLLIGRLDCALCLLYHHAHRRRGSTIEL